MKKVMTSVLCILLAMAGAAQIERKAFETAVDFLNCKLIEQVMAGGSAAAFEKFKAACPCSGNPDFRQLWLAISPAQAKTKQLAREVQGIKTSNIARKSKEAIIKFLSRDIFEDYARYPAVYEYATRQIARDQFYPMRDLLREEISSVLQTQHSPLPAASLLTSTIKPEYASQVISIPAPVQAATEKGDSVNKGEGPIQDKATKDSASVVTDYGSDIRILQQRIANLESAKGAEAGIFNHRYFQVTVLVLLLLLGGLLFWKSRRTTLTEETREEVKSLIDRKLLTKFSSLANGNNASVPKTEEKPGGTQPLS